MADHGNSAGPHGWGQFQGDEPPRNRANPHDSSPGSLPPRRGQPGYGGYGGSYSHHHPPPHNRQPPNDPRGGPHHQDQQFQPYGSQQQGPTPQAPVPPEPGVPTSAPASGAESVDPAQGPPRKSVARSSLIMAAGSLVSRMTGFGRTVVIGAALGATLLGNSYTTAQYFPQMIFELVMGGILTSVIVPLLVRAKKNDPDGGWAFTQRLLTLAFCLLATATLLVTLGAPLLAALMASEGNRSLVTQLSYLMLPAILFYGLAALLGGVLNSRERFGAPMWVPIINNLVVIGVGIAFFILYTRNQPIAEDGERIGFTLEAITPGMIWLLGAGTTAGIVLQVLALWPALRRAGFRWKWRFDFRAGLDLSQIGTLAAWTLVFVAFNQIAVIAVLRIANAASDTTDGFVPGALVYNNAYLMMMMAHGIVAVSVITALMPRMASAADDKRFAEVAAHMSSGARMAGLLLVPIAGAFIFLSVPISQAIFQWGSYTETAALATANALLVVGLILIPFSLSQLQIYAFYALTDTKTVALITIPVVAIRIGGYLLSFGILPAQWVVVGLIVSNGASYVASFGLSLMLLRLRLGLLGMRHVATGLLAMATAAAVAGAAVYLLWMALPDFSGSKGGQIGIAMLLGTMFIVLYALLCYLLRLPEARKVSASVRAKLGR
ncbi:murein biosynthesis integral membrane protein MurJ [Natronoglycomyces albus]|uniref:Murein biosynthesis integral membrane protein MurJ n=1 Tax=Natronoglycomyces albus TaxID=2811108 RepID=A0A895XSW9_9ACTN|nr:murein biosynthesis integral membrane protein MurJ [Natronoglycomyces albus]QSB05360.1 murein biosynthesis integral membrane protein MurJ [Natronoglycomyces albus]